MTTSFQRQIALLMNGFFIISLLLINMGSLAADRIIHDVQHEQHIEHSLVHHHAEGDQDDDHAFSLSEHLLLHSIDQLQHFSYLPLAENVIALIPGSAPLMALVQPIPLTSFDPPFRPPRFATELA